MWEKILEIIFPEECIGCGKSGVVLCALCERNFTLKAMAHSASTASLFDYRNPLVRRSIWALKYHRKKALGKFLGNAMYREFFQRLARSGKHGEEEFVLIPIPASKSALALRGYNHAAIIAFGIAEAGKRDGVRFVVREDILRKSRQNKRQVEMRSRTKRAENLKDIFTVSNGGDITGRSVILVDDVTTTGATFVAARKAIKEWGPKRLLALAVAH
jgi:ComF family protein